MATMSGRGVITSRTRLSLNSTICSNKSAWPGSIIPSSSAASTSASIPSESAREFEDDQSQPKMREQIKSERGLSSMEVQAGLDFRLKNLEVFAQAARGDTAETAINMVEIGKDRQSDGEKDDGECVEPDHWSGQPLTAAQTQAAAQAALHAVHLAAVGLVIVTQQMENAMQNQNAEFEGQRAAQAARVAPSGLRRNGDVAEIACGGIFPCEKNRERRFF